MCHSLQITHRIVHSHLPDCHLKAVHGGEGHIEVCPKFIGASCLASVKRGISLCVAEFKLNLKTCAVHSDDIAPRQSEVVGEKEQQEAIDFGNYMKEKNSKTLERWRKKHQK